METGEFLKYVNVVLAGSNRGCMEQALKELRTILKRRGAEQEKLDLLKISSKLTLVSYALCSSNSPLNIT